MMKYKLFNLYTLRNIFIIFVLILRPRIIISSKIVIPFNHYNLNSESFIQNNLENSIYSEIQVGTYNSFPEGKNIIMFLNTQKSISTISDLKICPSNSFYNKNESTSYQYKDGLSQDSFYLYNDIQLKKKEKLNEIKFEYKEENDKKIFCGMIGFNMINIIDNVNINFLNNLKKSNYTNNYYLSFNFNEKKAFDNYENLKGEIIIGELPHEYNKDKFNDEYFRQETVSLEDRLTNYNFIFDKIYVGLKDKEKNILIDNKNKSLLKAILEVSYGLISGPDIYKNYIEENFFNKTEISNICKKMEDYGRGMPYYIYVCDNEIKSKFNLFPDLIFYLQNSNYNFTFCYEDLFMLKNNKYYFNVIFVGGLDNWRFGLPFFLKYQLVFNQDTKQIGFYTNFTKKEEKNYIYNNIWFWIGISFVVIGIIIATVFITKKYFENKNRRKRANELDDGYDYDGNKEKEKIDGEKNLLTDEENK